MRLSPQKLLPPQHSSYYLHGEDQDAIFEAAEALLAAGEPEANRLRVDVNELARIESESKNQGLFGSSCCYALVRNAQSANPKQTEHLLKLAHSVLSDNRLIICAAGIDWKKALHKKMKAESALAQCEFHLPDEAGFRRWLQEEISKANLNMSSEMVSWMSEHLCGMRLAARQTIQRLVWYDGGTGEVLTLEVIGELLGERAPDALEDWCHAITKRDASALGLTRRLLYDQNLAEVQMLSWLGTRMQQILMYRWFQSRQERNPLQAAKVFGAARHKVAEESRCWNGTELNAAMNRIVAAEKLIKGASVEDNPIVIERLALDLITKGRLAA
jgi:DNA polymerase III delta subunit